MNLTDGPPFTFRGGSDLYVRFSIWNYAVNNQSSSPYPTADAALTLSLSESIFGPDVASRGSSAVIHLRNFGQDLQIGLNGGYSLLSAVSEPSITGFGPVQTSGITQGISETSVPEPGSFALLALAAAALGTCAITRWRKAAAASPEAHS